MMKLRLEQLREEKDFTKKQVADLLGVSISVYSRWESGKELMPTRRIYQLANYYRINIDYLLNLTQIPLEVVSSNAIDFVLISSRMREIRKDFNESLRVFAKRLNTSNSTWNAYETGKVLILEAFLFEICKMGNYSADWLLGRTDNKYLK